MLKVTNCKVYPVNSGRSKLLAFAHVELEDSFVFKCKVIEGGRSGVFVAMPSEKGNDGEYYDICFPVTKEQRQEITEAVLGAYDDETSEKSNSSRRGKRGK